MNSHILTPEELELSLILAQASSFTYSQKILFDDIQKKTGIYNVSPLNFTYEDKWCISGLLGYYKNYITIIFKGTDCPKDWKTNFHFWQNKIGFNGQVHSGFAQVILNNWNELLDIIQSYLSQDQKILLAGHSLGGALAILTASRLSSLPEFSNRIEAVYTYGAPRVGNEDFKNQYALTHYRFEYASDPVPSSPSLGYAHTDHRYYLPKNEPTIQKGSPGIEAYQTHIRLASVIVNVFVNTSNLGLINNSIEHIIEMFDDVSDHNIEKYIQHLQNYKQFIVIIQGLQDGTLRRHGSVIQDTRTGKTVCFLLEQPQKETNQLPISLVSKGASLFINSVHGQIPLQMSSIAIGASVLNVGISLAGFAYMSNKLKQIQTTLNNLQQYVTEGFDRIEYHLDILCLRVEYIRQQQESIREAISDLHQAFLIQSISELQAAIYTRSCFPQTPISETFHKAGQVGNFLSQQAQQNQPTLTTRTVLFTDVAMKGWAVARVTQAYLLLEDGQISEAQKFLNKEVTQFRTVTKRWVDNLVAHDCSEIATAYRFTAPVFNNNNITREQVDRIAYISSVDQGLSTQDIEQKIHDVKVAFQVSDNQENLHNTEWIETQIFVVSYLDTLSELLARLESLQAFAKFCKSTGVQRISDILPANDAESGLYLQFLLE